MKLPPIDVAIITIIKVEAEAVRAALGITDVDQPRGLRIPYENVAYCLKAVPHRKGEPRLPTVIAHVNAGKQGNTHLAVLTQVLIRELNPKLVILVGIAAGLEAERQIGDVVIPRIVIDFTLSRQKRDGDALVPKIHYSVTTHELPAICVGGLSTALDEAAFNRMNDDCKNALDAMEKRAPIAADIEAILSEISDEKCKAEMVAPEKKAGSPLHLCPDDYFLKHIASQKFKVIDRALASSNTLVRDKKLLVELSEQLKGHAIQGADMESAGVIAGCQPTGTPWLIMRGISDFGDHMKHDAFQTFASVRAAVCLKRYLENDFDRQMFTAAPNWTARRDRRYDHLCDRVNAVLNGFAEMIEDEHKEKVNISLYWCGNVIEAQSNSSVDVLWRTFPNAPELKRCEAFRHSQRSSDARPYLHADSELIVAKAAKAGGVGEPTYSDALIDMKGAYKWVCAQSLSDRREGAKIVAVLCMTTKVDSDAHKCDKDKVKRIVSTIKSVLEPMIEQHSTWLWTHDLRIGIPVPKQNWETREADENWARAQLRGYYSAMSATWLLDTNGVHGVPGRSKDVPKLRALLKKLSKRKTVLELGCGVGYWTSDIAEVATKVHAVDFVPEVLAVAKRRVTASNVTFGKPLDVLTDKTPMENVHLVVLFFLLSHLNEGEISLLFHKLRENVKAGSEVTVAIADNRFDESGNSYTPAAESAANSNAAEPIRRYPCVTIGRDTYEKRTTPDKREFLVRKNALSEDRLKELLAKHVDKLDFTTLTHYVLVSGSLRPAEAADPSANPKSA